MKTIIFVFILGAVFSIIDASALFCDSQDSSKVKFSVTSCRNKTGQWNSQIQLEHDVSDTDDGPWQFDVHQVTKKYDGKETIAITANLGEPRTETKKPPPSGYTRYEGHFYKYHSEAKTWNQARDICKSEGGHLAVLNSEAEAKYVAKLAPASYDWAFVGFHDLYEEGKFVTIFDQSLEEAGYNKWPSTDPNGGTRENCGVVFPNGLLGDYVCNNPRTFICEIHQ